MDYLKIIKQKAFRPIKHINISSPHFTLCVEFLNGVSISKKDEVGIRLFLSTIQHLEYKIISGSTEHCIVSPVGYWNLLGFRSGDAVLFWDDKEHFLPILFS